MILEVLPARKGDCLLLHSDTGEGKGIIVIDGGPAGVSGESLIPRLMALREDRGLGQEEPLLIDLLIVSHVDDDHINGVIDLLEQMKERRDIDHKPPLFEIADLWHNSFDDIVGNKEAQSLGKSPAFGAASMGAVAEEEEEAGPRQDVAMILASVSQGDRLRELAADLGVPLNAAFGEELIKTRPGESVIREVAGIRFTVIGPRQAELEILERDFDRWLQSKPPQERTAPAFLAGLDDKSVANLSSIVLLAEAGGKTILLTGDARSDYILKGMEESGLIAERGELPVDILKMPHHGSIRNLDEEGEFLRRVPARHYVFSGDGEHGNPDRETLELLFRTRGNAAMNLYFTYAIEEIDRKREREHEKERGKRRQKNRREGPRWSDLANSLEAALELKPAQVKVVEPDGTPMQI